MKIRQWTHSLLARTVAFFLLVLAACVAAGCIAGSVMLVEQNFYTRGIEAIKEDVFYRAGHGHAFLILHDVLKNAPQLASAECKNSDLSAAVSDKDGTPLWSSGGETQAAWELTYYFDAAQDDTEAAQASYFVHLYLDGAFREQSEFSFLNLLINLGFALRYWIYVIGVAALLLTVGSFVFLMCSAGHRVGQEEIAVTGLAKIPFDLLTFLLLLAAYVTISFVCNEFSSYGDMPSVILLMTGFVVAVVVGTAYCMNFAVRVKRGGWWRNTVLYRLCRLAARMIKIIGHGLLVFLRNLPVLWKTLLALAALSTAEFLGILACCWEPDILLLLWILEKAVLIPAALYLVLILRRLQKGGEALAEGDLSYQLDTRWMVWDFKRHGENLNSIAAGMTRAVDERMKGERLKTELITNVSHDIKTPLTSIINYSDLIGKAETDSGQVKEYAGVLLRQSERLKKLIEDLVEASKASTGNVEVLLAPCEAGVLLTQAAGEYEQRLRESRLELVAKQPESPVRIMADGRHLWRVFDNLLSNICKYAQGGTRVYISVEERGGEAVISFKNTSRYPLDLSAEELLERFARGDRSRSTEGNGLGLSIARSLMELQGGRLDLTVDGDLFKVVLRFPRIT